MAATYKVSRYQNVFDVAIQLYGSIEGLFDLLMTNDDLSMDDVLEAGQELQYHSEYIIKQDIFKAIETTGLVVANGEGIQPITHSSTMLGIIKLHRTYVGAATFRIAGSGTIQIDWGDGSIDEYTLSSYEQSISHMYLSTGTFNVTIYGEDGSITVLDLSGAKGEFYPIYAKTSLAKYCETSNLLASNSLLSLFSASELKYLELRNRTEALDLSTYLGSYFNLQYLDVRGSNISTTSVNSFLSGIQSNISEYESLTCYLDSSQVDEDGYLYIYDIIDDSTYGGRYHFFIDGYLITNRIFAKQFTIQFG